MQNGRPAFLLARRKHVIDQLVPFRPGITFGRATGPPDPVSPVPSCQVLCGGHLLNRRSPRPFGARVTCGRRRGAPRTYPYPCDNSNIVSLSRLFPHRYYMMTRALLFS